MPDISPPYFDIVYLVTLCPSIPHTQYSHVYVGNWLEIVDMFMYMLTFPKSYHIRYFRARFPYDACRQTSWRGRQQILKSEKKRLAFFHFKSLSIQARYITLDFALVFALVWLGFNVQGGLKICYLINQHPLFQSWYFPSLFKMVLIA